VLLEKEHSMRVATEDVTDADTKEAEGLADVLKRTS
jgi:hypothetical protein